MSCKKIISIIFSYQIFKKIISNIYKGVETALTAFKGVLEDLTEITIKENTEVYKENGRTKVDVVIPREDIFMYLEETLVRNGVDKKLMSKEGPNISSMKYTLTAE